MTIYNCGTAAFEQKQSRDTCLYKYARTGFQAQRYQRWMRGFDDAMIIASDQRLFDKARQLSVPIG